MSYGQAAPASGGDSFVVRFFCDVAGRHAVQLIVGVDMGALVGFVGPIRELKSLGVGVYFEKEYIQTALYLTLTPNTGLFFAYCSIYCGFVGASEPSHCGLSLICRLKLLLDTTR